VFVVGDDAPRAGIEMSVRAEESISVDGVFALVLVLATLLGLGRGKKKNSAPPIYRSSRSFLILFDGRDLGRSSLPLDRQGPTDDDDDALEASHGERSGDTVGSLRSEAKLAMMRTKIASVDVVVVSPLSTARPLFRVAGGSSGGGPAPDLRPGRPGRLVQPES
jgi:hypothetical protein